MRAAEALAGWAHAQAQHRAFILTSPEGHALNHVAREVIRQLTGEIAELRAQLDAQHPEPPVICCMERDLGTAMAQAQHEIPGTVIRATDTLREWRKCKDGTWEEEET